MPGELTPTNDRDRLAKLSWSAVRRLLRLAVPETRTLIAAGILALLGSAVTLTLPLIARSTVDVVIRSGDVRALDARIPPIAGLIALATLFGFSQFVLGARAGLRIVARLRAELFAHLLRLPAGFFDRHRSGDLASHLTTDAGQVQEVLTHDLVGLPGNLLTLVGGIVVAFVIDWRLTLVVVGLLALAMAFFVIFGRALRKLTREGLDRLALTTGGMTEALANARLVKQFGRERYEADRATENLIETRVIQMRAAKWEGMMGAVAASGFLLVVLGVTWYGGRAVVAKTLTSGDLFAFLTTVMLISGPMGSLASLATKLQRAIAAGDRVFELLDESPETPDSSSALALPPGTGRVEFRGVTFGYDPARPVLRELDLVLEAGRTTALVGPSGGGKTTIGALLFRLYEPQSGSVLLDGVDLVSLRRQELREAVAIVPQEPVLFSGSLRDNVRYGRLDASDDEIARAVADANVAEFADRLPEGLETLVGERGITLSGGQRQRVAIARALLKNPRVLVLDEATSALDTANERLVQEALDRLMAGRTTLVIAHRLTTVRHADLIAVVEEGRIVESGGYEELLSSQGAFARLAAEGTEGDAVTSY